MGTKTFTAMPADYQGEVDSAERQKQLATLMMTRYQKQPQGEMVGRRYIAPNILEHLGNLMGQAGAQNNFLEADKLRSNAMQRYQTDSTAATEEYLRNATTPRVAEEGTYAEASPDFQGATNKALISQFPQVRDLATTLAKQRMDLFRAGSSAATPASVIRGVREGGAPNVLAARPQELWETSTRPGLPGLKGELRQQMVQRNLATGQERVLDETPNEPIRVSATATNAGVKLGDAEKVGVKAAFEQIKESEAPARGQAKSLMSIQEALSALDQGVETGRLSGAENFVRGVMASLGVTGTGVEGFDALSSALKRITFDTLGGLGKQISDDDRKFMESTTGSTLQDPMALRRALALTAVANMQGVEAHNQRAQMLSKTYPELVPHMEASKVRFNFVPGSSAAMKPGAPMIGDQMVQALLQGKSTFDVLPATPTVGIKDAVGAGKAPAGLTPQQEARRRELRKLLGKE
jgi:hypothetical protein